MAAKVVVVGRSSTALAGVGAARFFLTAPLQVRKEAVLDPDDGFTLLKGFVNCDRNCTVDVYQGWTFADVAAITAPAGAPNPAVGANDGVLLHSPFPHAGAALSDGTPFTATIVAPWVRIRVANTSGLAAAQFRFHAEAAE